MIYHQIDFFLLEAILKKKDTTTWKIAEDFCKEDNINFKDKKEEERFFTNESDKICKRLKRMAEEGLVKVYKGNGNRGNKNVYEVNLRRVILKQRYKFPNGYGKALFLKEKDRKWQVFQV